jgi:DNA-binding NtrC family response regulator
MKDIFERLVDHFVGNGFSMDEAVAVLERAMIARALEKTGGNRCAASKMLNVHRNTLQRKIAEYGLDVRAARRKPPSRVRAGRKRANASE